MPRASGPGGFGGAQHQGAGPPHAGVGLMSNGAPPPASMAPGGHCAGSCGSVGLQHQQHQQRLGHAGLGALAGHPGMAQRQPPLTHGAASPTLGGVRADMGSGDMGRKQSALAPRPGPPQAQQGALAPGIMGADQGGAMDAAGGGAPAGGPRFGPLVDDLLKKRAQRPPGLAAGMAALDERIDRAIGEARRVDQRLLEDQIRVDATLTSFARAAAELDALGARVQALRESAGA